FSQSGGGARISDASAESLAQVCVAHARMRISDKFFEDVLLSEVFCRLRKGGTAQGEGKYLRENPSLRISKNIADNTDASSTMKGTTHFSSSLVKQLSRSPALARPLDSSDARKDVRGSLRSKGGNSLEDGLQIENGRRGFSELELGGIAWSLAKLGLDHSAREFVECVIRRQPYFQARDETKLHHHSNNKQSRTAGIDARFYANLVWSYATSGG
ncbi:unnamed protein product, partial [Amoebophrya sp. A25]